MTIQFTAAEVKAMVLDTYYVLSFADSNTDPMYVSIHLAKAFNAQDVALGQDGEYFEYGDGDDIGAEYKCVRSVVCTREKLVFSLKPPLKGTIEEIKIRLEVPLNEAALKYLKMMFAARLSIK